MTGTVKYLFDTDSISVLMRGRAPAGFIDRLSATKGMGQAISAVTVYEVYFGAWRSPEPERFITIFETKVLPLVEVLYFDDTAARIAGRIRAERERAGRPIALADLQIAAIALASGSILVTGNSRHFADIPGLDSENWLE